MTRRLPWASRRPVLPTEDRPPLPSLNLLLQVAMQERDKQLAHFDALDTKAGVLLAFDGVLIVISHGVRLAFQLPGVMLTAASAALALGAFWPRKFPTLDPWILRPFLTYDTERVGLRLHDTVARMVTEGRQVLHTKARNLKLALALLLLAVFTFGAGTIATTVNTSGERAQHGTQRPTQAPTRTRGSATTSSSAS